MDRRRWRIIVYGYDEIPLFYFFLLSSTMIMELKYHPKQLLIVVMVMLFKAGVGNPRVNYAADSTYPA
jgi:hypothetical protein